MPSDLDGLTVINYNRNRTEVESKIRTWVGELRSNKKPIEPIKITMIECIPIPPGIYNRLIDDKEIEINNTLYVSKNLITQATYRSIMGNNPSCFKDDLLPVENISFREAITFCNKLSKEKGYGEVYTIADGRIKWNETVKGYRLPFEIEWEYVLDYDDIEVQRNLDTIAWYQRNSNQETHKVGSKKGNRYGLFDLLGNVWEWCFDNYKQNPPQTTVLEDNTNFRVLRGGSFADFAVTFTRRNAFRKSQDEFTKNEFTGFRIVLQNIEKEN